MYYQKNKIPRTQLEFKNRRLDNLTPEVMLKSAWVSTALALIFTLPPLGLFIGLYEYGINIGVAAGIGFSLHFATLLFSRKISSGLTKLFDD